NRQRKVGLLIESILVGRDALGRPQAEIDRRTYGRCEGRSEINTRRALSFSFKSRNCRFGAHHTIKSRRSPHRQKRQRRNEKRPFNSGNTHHCPESSYELQVAGHEPAFVLATLENV